MKHGDEGRSDTVDGGRAVSGRAKLTGVDVMLWGPCSFGLGYLSLVNTMYGMLLQVSYLEGRSLREMTSHPLSAA
jgi:hypothetical protein